MAKAEKYRMLVPFNLVLILHILELPIAAEGNCTPGPHTVVSSSGQISLPRWSARHSLLRLATDHGTLPLNPLHTSSSWGTVTLPGQRSWAGGSGSRRPAQMLHLTKAV